MVKGEGGVCEGGFGRGIRFVFGNGTQKEDTGGEGCFIHKEELKKKDMY